MNSPIDFFNSIKKNISTYGKMIKFSHTIFALPYALSAVILAARKSPVTLWQVLWILAAMTGARSAAMGFNRIVDSKIDEKNPRTARREIPSGELSMGSAICFTLIFSFLFIFSAAMLGPLCLYLSIPMLVALFLYSYTKRFTWLCHIYLGFAISLAPAGAWIALTGSLSWPVVWLSLALMTNIAGFDILYACQDAEFDKEQGLFSLPAYLGIKNALRTSSAIHVFCFGFFMLIYWGFNLGPIYLAAAAIIGILLIIEHRLVKPHDLSNVHIAFFQINSIISITLLTGILADVLIFG